MSLLVVLERHSIGNRRSSREFKLPQNLNDYIIKGKYKYGIERNVSYAFLDSKNKCFVSNLIKILNHKLILRLQMIQIESNPRMRKWRHYIGIIL